MQFRNSDLPNEIWSDQIAILNEFGAMRFSALSGAATMIRRLGTIRNILSYEVK